MRKHLLRILIYLFIALLLGGFAWYQHGKKGEGNGKRHEKDDKALHVCAYILSAKELQDNLQVTGSLNPDEEVDLAFESPGKVVSIDFREGSAVHKGQLLAKVNDGPLQAQLKKLQSQVKLAEDRVYRQQTLLKKEAVSQEAYEEVKTELATLHADIELVNANIKQTRLLAPFDGIIGLRQISVGTYASTSTIVARLTKVVPLKLEFAIPERYSNELRVGSPVDFTLEGEEQVFRAAVYAIDSRVDAETRTLTVRAIYPNSDRRLKPGRYAQIKLEKETILNALAVPSQAIIPEMGKDKVFVFRSGKAQPIEITTGLRTESMVQVLKGLNVGDTLITTGTMQLRTDMNVILDKITK